MATLFHLLTLDIRMSLKLAIDGDGNVFQQYLKDVNVVCILIFHFSRELYCVADV